MALARGLAARLLRWEHSLLCLMVLVTLVTHFAIINSPTEVVLDEVYYVADAKNIMEEHTTERPEHPPLGKLMVSASIALFGDNPIGWRTFPIIFGTANIFLLYLICRRLGLSRRATNIATFLIAFENLSFVHASIAMLDVFNLTFILLAFWLYLRRSYPLAAIAVSLAALVKLTGVLALAAIVLHWLIVRRDEARRFITSMTLAPLYFLLLLPVLELIIYRRPVDLISDVATMLSQSTSLTFATVTHPSIIHPWSLLVIPRVMPYNWAPHYLGATSFTLWALIIPVFAYMIVKSWRRNDAAVFGAAWFTSLYLAWIPFTLLTDRVTYPYYIYPALGAIAIGLGMGLDQALSCAQEATGGRRLLIHSSVVFFLLLHLGVFVFLAPVNPWPLSQLLGQ